MQPSPPARRNQAWMWAGGAAGLALAVTSFLGAHRARPAAAPSPPATEMFVVTGAVVLDDARAFTRDDHAGCAGTGGHAGVRDGAAVVLIAGGAAFAGGRLREGQALFDGTCRFWFAVRNVPAGQGPYLIQIADEDARQYPEQDIHGPLVTLRLG